ncbi:hypothetical protein MGA447_2697 [Enterococcus faecalis]|nr:hypothetical protein EFDM72_0842 [Enterococcus faecalis]OSH16551.1 hypothetical protein MGA447_2697 [Enterococcus faecalis]
MEISSLAVKALLKSVILITPFEHTFFFCEINNSRMAI